MTDTIQLAWGSNVHPDDTVAAWGARMIVNQQGMTDLLGDRQDAGGKHVHLLIERLNAGLLREIRELISELLAGGTMLTRTRADFILHMDGDLVVHANTNASAGYCYVSAFILPERKQ